MCGFGHDLPFGLGFSSRKATRGVIVDHARGLHEGVANGRADELAAVLPERLAQCIRFRRGRGRGVRGIARRVDGFAVDE